MNTGVLLVNLANLALIGLLPRIFFRRGRLNLRWWITAAPFLVVAGTLIGGLSGILETDAPVSPMRDSLAVLLGVGSMILIGATIRSHREPLSLWHQNDGPTSNVVVFGAYALVRHPFYAAFLIALLAATIGFPHVLNGAAFLFACYQLNRTAALEERRILESDHGEFYRRYRERTGRFVPRIRSQTPRAA